MFRGTSLKWVVEAVSRKTPLGEVGWQEIVATVNEVIERRGSENEEPLQQEVPEYRNDDGHRQSRYREAEILDHTNRIEIGAVGQNLGKILRAEGVEQQTAKPNEEKFDADSPIWTFTQSERELVVYQAVDYAANGRSDGGGHAGAQAYPGERGETDEIVGVGWYLRSDDRAQEHKNALAVQKSVFNPREYAHCLISQIS